MNDKSRRRITIRIVFVIIVLLIGYACVYIAQEEEFVYKVATLPESGTTDAECPLYVKTAVSEYVDVEKKLSIYYFEAEEKKIEIYLQPSIKDGRVVMEKYNPVSVNKGGYTFSKEGYITDKLFLLAEKTSADNPLILFSHEQNCYGIVGEYAYMIAYGYTDEIPEMLPKVYYGNLETVVYEVNRDGTFQIIP